LEEEVHREFPYNFSLGLFCSYLHQVSLIMKVKIGPYTSWLGPYQLAEKLMFWVPKEPDEIGIPRTADRVHDFGERLSKVNWLNNCLNLIESKKKRKIEIHIDNYDTWSMDSTLAYIILPMLKQLKATKHGSPFVDDKDVPKELRSTSAPPKKNEYDTDDNHFKRWDWVLDEMIWAFEQKNSEWEEQYYSGEIDRVYEEVNEIDGEKFYEMKEGPNHTFKVDHKGYKKHHDRMKNGFRLFGKYYEGLWD